MSPSLDRVVSILRCVIINFDGDFSLNFIPVLDPN
jgi:hypothetical protein